MFFESDEAVVDVVELVTADGTEEYRTRIARLTRLLPAKLEIAHNIL